jgi:hypothetical protein
VLRRAVLAMIRDEQLRCGPERCSAKAPAGAISAIPISSRPAELLLFEPSELVLAR